MGKFGMGELGRDGKEDQEMGSEYEMGQCHA